MISRAARWPLWVRMSPVALSVATGGCLATRNDLRVLQGDIATLRTDLLRNDGEQRDALGRVAAQLAVANDSLARISVRTVGTQGDVRGEMRAVREQIQQVQQLVVQLQGSINRTRAELEERNNAIAAAAAAAVPSAAAGGAVGGAAEPSALAGATGTTASLPVTGKPAPVPPAAVAARSGMDTAPAAGASAAPKGPGAMQLYTSGLDQLKRGSTATARTVLQELLSTYPTSDHAPDAQFYIAESLMREKNLAGADAAYSAVVAKYPQSARAATAHYKRAQIAVQQGNSADARKLFTEVVNRFPGSNEAVLAADQLKQLR